MKSWTPILESIWSTSVMVLLFVAVSSPASLLADDFDNLKNEFQSKATASLGSDPTQTWNLLSFYASRALLGSIAETEFNKSEVNLSGIFPSQVLSPQPSAIDLKMPHIIKSCAPRCFSCCDCGWLSPKCCLCDAAQTACFASEAPIVATCLAAKGILDAAAGAHIGSIEFQQVALMANLDPTPLTVKIDSGFSKATLNGSMKVNAVVQGSADVHLETLTSIFTACFILKSINLPRTRVDIVSVTPTFESKLDPTPSDDGVSLQLSLQKTSLNLQFKISPLLTAIANNPDLIVTCPLPAGVGVVAGAADQVFDFDKSIDIDAQAIPPRQLGQLSVRMPGRPAKTKLNPRTNSLAVGVTEAQTF